MKGHVGEMGSSMRAIRLQVNELCNEDASRVQVMWTKVTDSEGCRSPDVIHGSESPNKSSGNNFVRSDAATLIPMDVETLPRQQSQDSSTGQSQHRELEYQDGW